MQNEEKRLSLAKRTVKIVAVFFSVILRINTFLLFVFFASIYYGKRLQYTVAYDIIYTKLRRYGL